MSKSIVMLGVGGVVALGTLIYYLFLDLKNKPMKHRSRQGTNQPSRNFPTSYSDIKRSPSGNPAGSRDDNISTKPKIVVRKSSSSDKLACDRIRKNVINSTELSYERDRIGSSCSTERDRIGSSSPCTTEVGQKDLSSPLTNLSGSHEEISTEPRNYTMQSSSSDESAGARENRKFTNNSESSNECDKIRSQSPRSTESVRMNISFPVPCEVCDEPVNVRLFPCEHEKFCSDHYKQYLVHFELYDIAPRCPECRLVIDHASTL